MGRRISEILPKLYQDELARTDSLRKKVSSLQASLRNVRRGNVTLRAENRELKRRLEHAVQQLARR
jgi:regulator of replication initiation timing